MQDEPGDTGDTAGLDHVIHEDEIASSSDGYGLQYSLALDMWIPPRGFSA
jgi:hypothetical protein